MPIDELQPKPTAFRRLTLLSLIKDFRSYAIGDVTLQEIRKSYKPETDHCGVVVTKAKRPT